MCLLLLSTITLWRQTNSWETNAKMSEGSFTLCVFFWLQLRFCLSQQMGCTGLNGSVHTMWLRQQSKIVQCERVLTVLPSQWRALWNSRDFVDSEMILIKRFRLLSVLTNDLFSVSDYMTFGGFCEHDGPKPGKSLKKTYNRHRKCLMPVHEFARIDHLSLWLFDHHLHGILTIIHTLGVTCNTDQLIGFYSLVTHDIGLT